MFLHRLIVILFVVCAVSGTAAAGMSAFDPSVYSAIANAAFRASGVLFLICFALGLFVVAAQDMDGPRR